MEITWEEIARIFNGKRLSSVKGVHKPRGVVEIEQAVASFCGPIRKITIDRGEVCFDLIWCARRASCTSRWQATKTRDAIVLNASLAKVTAPLEGYILIESPEIRAGWIFLGAGEEDWLKPEEVDGLDLNNLPKPEVTETGEVG
ncbi:MAG TPA: hypothetical protein P5328_02650 [Candidatus Paceibacterota bacterium]|nr:hypothetical protein [Candidatus Paceibacterota bacterium]HRZ34341.1 hypothetical protein [Candidatus Paceibacterota bacterium]